MYTWLKKSQDGIWKRLNDKQNIMAKKGNLDLSRIQYYWIELVHMLSQLCWLKLIWLAHNDVYLPIEIYKVNNQKATTKSIYCTYRL